MAGDCGGKKPKPATTVNTQDTKKPKPANSEASKGAQETKQTQKETVTQQTSSPVGEAQVQSQTVTKKVPVSQEEPKETHTPKTPEEIAAEAAIVAAKNAIDQLQVDLNVLKTEVDVIEAEKNGLKKNNIKKCINGIASLVIDTTTDYNQVTNSKDFAQEISLKTASLTNLTEIKIRDMIYKELDILNDIITNQKERNIVWGKATQAVSQTITIEVQNFNKVATTSLNNLVTVLGDANINGSALTEIETAITAINKISVPAATANKQTVLSELNTVNTGLGNIETALASVQADVNTLKTAVQGTILETISINDVIIEIEAAISSVDQNAIDKVKKAVDDAIAAVNNLP